MKILHKYWFTGSFGTIGIVTGVDPITNARKGYIGQAGGTDEDYDANLIMETGSPVAPGIISEILKDIKI